MAYFPLWKHKIFPLFNLSHHFSLSVSIKTTDKFHLIIVCATLIHLPCLFVVSGLLYVWFWSQLFKLNFFLFLSIFSPNWWILSLVWSFFYMHFHSQRMRLVSSGSFPSPQLSSGWAWLLVCWGRNVWMPTWRGHQRWWLVSARQKQVKWPHIAFLAFFNNKMCTAHCHSCLFCTDFMSLFLSLSFFILFFFWSARKFCWCSRKLH